MTAALTGRQRLERAHDCEQLVAAELRDRGWHVEPFGQVQIGAARAALARFRDADGRPALIRWMPDLLVHDDADEPRVYLIDVKEGSPNISIEDDSCRAMTDAAERYGLPVLYVVCPNYMTGAPWRTLDPFLFREHRRRGPQNGNGSRTLYSLLSYDFARPFDDTFPRLH